MLIRMNESDLDRWKPKISFKSVVTKLLHGHLKPVRDWIWKHLFPHSWKRMEARINELLKKLYNDVDKFLAYGDTIQPIPLNKWSNAPTILGHPSDKLEFVDMKPAPRYIWQKIIEERDLKYKQQEFANSIGFKEYLEFIKEEICVATGISKEDLFEGAKLVFPTPIESWQVEYMQNPHPPVPPPNQAAMDYVDTIKGFTETMQGTSEGDAYKLLEPMTVEKNGVKMLWTDYLKGKRKELTATQRKRQMQNARIAYFDQKAEYHKNRLRRTCFTSSCSQELTFWGLISANEPKTFKEYRWLKKLWFAEYKSKKIPKISLHFYCCDCIKEQESWGLLKRRHRND